MNTLLLVLTGLTLGMVAFASSSDTITFDNAETGKPPAGWTAGQTGSGQAIWTVVPDATLRVDFQGAHFTVTLDGQRALEWDDDTFKEAGRVGVWTKADSVTLFDDFSYAAR